MPPKLSSSPSPRTFLESYRREVLEPAAAKLAGSDGMISASEARRADALLTGKDKLAAKLFSGLARELQRAADVDSFVAAASDEVLKVTAAAAGSDGRLSRDDAAKLPAELQEAYFYLQTGKFPPPALRYSKDVLQAVMKEHGLTDPMALLERAAQHDDGNRYLTRAELSAAAAALAQPPTDALSRAMPADWRAAIDGALPPGHLEKLGAFLEKERATETIYPPPAEVFSALEHTPLEKVKVVILGQDPYHGPGEGHGLSFSVKPGVKVPPSLRNIFKELQADLGAPPPSGGTLTPWADQGVLMLNAVLTVQKDKPASHRDQGWEQVTDAMLKKVNEKDERVVFVLLGADAQKKAALIDTSRHTIIKAAHPSPFSANHGFLGSRLFSRTNEALQDAGRGPIDWRLD